MGSDKSTVLELLSQRGEFADHYSSADPDGFAGWHTIHGPIIGWGGGDRFGAVYEWWGEHPLLPLLRQALVADLDRPALNGVRIFFGSNHSESTAEVRVNGRVSPGASAALLNLEWPRVDGAAYARSFVLLVHPSPET